MSIAIFNAQVYLFKLLVLSDLQSKTQSYSVYYHKWLQGCENFGRLCLEKYLHDEQIIKIVGNYTSVVRLTD